MSVLRETNWSIRATAKHYGVYPKTVYRWMDHHAIDAPLAQKFAAGLLDEGTAIHALALAHLVFISH